VGELKRNCFLVRPLPCQVNKQTTSTSFRRYPIKSIILQRKEENIPVSRQSAPIHVGLILAGMFLVIVTLCTARSAAAAPLYLQHNLVADISGVADHTEPNLVNPWGMSSGPASPFWISDNRTGVSTLYNGSGQQSVLVVSIPPAAGGTPPSAPTGQVFNGTTDFAVGSGTPALFIFATENGTISGWNSGTNAFLAVNNSRTADYKGLAIGNNGSNNLLYAANFSAGTIDVFNGSFAPITLSGSFIDPSLPAGFAPFNIQNLVGNLYVTYAKLDGSGHDAVAGPGNGFVDVFDTNGNFMKRLVTGGPLNSPWGLALAPGNFGAFSNDLLVGNFGDGSINAFDPATGTYLGQMLDCTGNPLINPGLWGLKFGNGGNGGDLDTLYFTASGAAEDHGLFGSLQSQTVPEPSTLFLLGAGLGGLVLLRRKANIQ
jgi:uncharacterized protein (TIGR03118 family)